MKVTTTMSADSIPPAPRSPFAGDETEPYGLAMGFLDKLLGRAKETAGDAADKAAPVVDKAQDAAGDAWDKASDVASDAVDEAKDAVSDLTDRGDEAVDSAEPGSGTSGSAPPAA